ncbi:hypothetical protein IT881_08730 [Erythrobacter sp. A30-3]|nr:hypothetical protein IT881_08730 [Erythrobacter sp. A30-3]
MPTKPEEHDISMMLGEIKATTNGTAEDVRGLRIEMGHLYSTVSALTSRIQAIETDRDAMKPDYAKFVHKVNNYIHEDTIWKSQHDGKNEGVTTTTKVVWAVVALLVSVGMFVAGQMLKPEPPQPAHQTVKVESK